MSIEQIDSLPWAHPLVREWFLGKFGMPTEPQEQGWPSILASKTTLISAPTGSGKTFAAFLACIDKLVRKSLAGELDHQTEVLYVSPLKALSNDVQKNLTGPLNEILELAKKRGLKMAEIRVAVRTGDTLMGERQAMLRKPPHILVTTPESFYILLTAEKSRAMLRNIKTVIIDEIHAMADDKRGAHLTLSLERLEALIKNSPVRIGLSATQKPIEIVAEFLTGNNREKPVIINIGHRRQLELSIEVPSSELAPVASNEMWDEIYERIAKLANENRSTLVFVNTRRLAERVAHHLTEKLGEDQVLAHHGSLSRKLRLAAETKLKNGELKVLVATASLELGIDIGNIDLVIQMGSPRAIAVALQRIGRAGHWHGAISRGKLFATTRDELVECAALVYAIRQGDLDQLIIPEQPLDILAQQIVATCATGDWQEEELFALIKHAHPYKNLSRETFNSVLEMLSEGIAGSRGRYGTYLFRDRVNSIVKARRGARLTAITSGGAIPETGLFAVIAEPNGTMVGTLDEDFAVESNRGDIILLGTTSWRIKRVEGASGRVLVENAHGAPPSVPFWRGEAPSRTKELSLQVSDLRKKISDLTERVAHKQNVMPAEAGIQEINKSSASKVSHPCALDAGVQVGMTKTWLKENCGLDDSGAEQFIEYILLGKSVLGAVPTQTTVIAERFFDESGGMQLIIHAPFGARINKAWGLALRKCFCRSFNFELQAAATDNGINIALAEQHSFPLADVFRFLHPNTFKEVLVQAVLQAPLFTTRWRWSATRSLALPRFRNGKKIPPNILRMRADDLLAAVFPDAAACQDNIEGDIQLPDHPLTNEAMKDVLTEALDFEGLLQILKNIESGAIKYLAVDTPTPSAFSHEILNANPYAYLDDAPLEERRARAVQMRQILPESVLQEIGKLDPAAIKEVQQQAWPDVRNADELHDTLQTLIALPTDMSLREGRSNPELSWEKHFEELITAGRAGIASINGNKFYFAAEKAKIFTVIYPQAILQSQLKEIAAEIPERETAIVSMIRGWMQHLGPTTACELSENLQLSLFDIEQALLRLENTGSILRGQFRFPSVELDGGQSMATMTKPVEEWCERRLLARIHRLTLGALRKQIEPVTAAQFMRWLLQWQRVATGTQLKGEKGLLEIIKQLQGFEVPANAWERHILAKRVSDYDRNMLDRLCFSGAIGWGRLSPHPAFRNEETPERVSPSKQITPTSIAPITFFVREDSQWMWGHKKIIDETELINLSHIAKSIYNSLKQKGASFFADIVRSTGHLKAEVEKGLWELVAAGVITADAFDNLRALIDPKRRLGKRGINFSAGRWSLLHAEETVEYAQQMETICWVLLKRYGVVFRDLLAREKIIPKWRELLIAFRRLEDRGEIRGGRFVDGFLGEQFALPYAVDSLRAIKKQQPTHEMSNISAVDPLNLVGIILPGARISAISNNKVILQDGIPLGG